MDRRPGQASNASAVNDHTVVTTANALELRNQPPAPTTSARQAQTMSATVTSLFRLSFIIGFARKRLRECGHEVEYCRVQKWNASGRAAVSLLVALVLTSCAGSRHYHPIPAEGPPETLRYLELRAEASVATLHFPAGVYSLHAADDVGYYYAAPRKIAQHTALGSKFREGGIYVNKRNPAKLRGYVILAGARTHVGNLSRVKHEFRD